VSARGQRGGGVRGGSTPSPRSWEERLDDPHEPLYTIGVASELLSIDSQALRRLEEAIAHTSSRPSGNQRRYSRRDLQLLASAAELSAQGYPSQAIARILELEGRLGEP
jgi:MerR family transcriptional regulator, heat shock protein HspR